MSEWMKVMLEEIARKKQDAEQAQIEQRRRREEEAAALPPESDHIPKRR
ncbi:MAG TPA: hypothetical protein VMQ54_06365 [Steroidobacteraceae bacterium]|nr:hypothetical protein [Steroidobacteraceae bacterium]